MINALAQQIIDVYSAHYQFFFSKPNVTGIAYGYKVTNGINTCEPSIHVFVKKKVSANCLPKNGMIPSLYKGVKTDVIETGKFFSGDNSSLINNGCSNRCNPNILGNRKFCNNPDYTGKVRPLQPGWGMSVYGRDYIETGTLGYIVIDKSQVSRTYCLLSVNKTFANYNKQQIGDVVIQPSIVYGGKAPEDVVGNLLRYHPLKFNVKTDPMPPLDEMNVIDASIASFFNAGSVQLINPFIPPKNIVPTGITRPDIGKNIQWTGCLSEYRTGTISSIGAILSVTYPGDVVGWFKNIIIITGLSSFQDEGALVVDDTRKAIGLVFSYGQFFGNLVCSIKNIEEILNVSLLTV